MEKLMMGEKPMALVKRIEAVRGYEEQGLEELLVNLCTLGVPNLHRMQRGWWVTLKMHVAAAGTEFTVKSESDCPTPLAAARQCAGRAVEALRGWL